MRIAILGAGSAGQGIAGYLALKGHDVTLYNRTAERIAVLSTSKSLKVSGVIEGTAPVQTCSCIADAVRDCNFIFVTARAFGHEPLIKECLPHLERNAIIVVFTAYWAALRLQSLLSTAAREDLTIAETTLLPLACQVIEPGHVNITGIKSTMRMATYPLSRLSAVYQQLHPVLPMLVKGKSVMETSLENYNPMIHVPLALFNVRELEEQSDTFRLYHKGISERVARVIDAVDAERMRVVTKVGLDLMTARQMVKDYYNVRGTSTCDVIRNWEAVKEYVLPDPFSYVREELCYGLAPLASLCDLLNIPAEATKMLIAAWSVLDSVDYAQRGITVRELGLSGMTAEEILQHVSEG